MHVKRTVPYHLDRLHGLAQSACAEPSMQIPREAEYDYYSVSER